MNHNQMQCINQWLGRLDPGLVLDENGFCPLRVGTVELGIQMTRAGEALYFFGDVMKVQRGNEALLRHALEANYLQTDSFGGWLAVNPQRHVLELQQVSPLATMSGAFFIDSLMDFVASLQKAKRALSRVSDSQTTAAAPVAQVASRSLPMSGFA